MQMPNRSFKASDDLWERIRAAADVTGITASEMLRRAALDYEPIKRVGQPYHRPQAV